MSPNPTVFDMAQARLQAVENMDRILARQREQTEEMERFRAEQDALLLAGASDFFAAIHKYESETIKAALKLADKSVVGAARRLGVSYQWLAYAIRSRHPELAEERRPVHRRGRG